MFLKNDLCQSSYKTGCTVMQYNVMLIHTACKTLPHSQNMLTALEKIGTDIYKQTKTAPKITEEREKDIQTNKTPNSFLFFFLFFFVGGGGGGGEKKGW